MNIVLRALEFVFEHLPIILVLTVIIAAAITFATTPEAPKVKSHDAIDEEIRRERVEIHNTSLHYAELQRAWIQDNTPTPLNAARLEQLLATAFREGAKWQQRRP